MKDVVANNITLDFWLQREKEQQEYMNELSFRLYIKEISKDRYDEIYSSAFKVLQNIVNEITQKRK